MGGFNGDGVFDGHNVFFMVSINSHGAIYIYIYIFDHRMGQRKRNRQNRPHLPPTGPWTATARTILTRTDFPDLSWLTKT